MNDQLTADAERFSEFLTTHYPPAREWDDPIGYCAWYISHGYAAVVVDDDYGGIVAMGTARPVDRPGFGVLPFYHKDGSKSLHIDLLIDASNDERAILTLWQLLTLRFQPLETVTMFRHEEEQLHVYRFDRFCRNVRRIKKAKTKKETHHVISESAQCP